MQNVKNEKLAITTAGKIEKAAAGFTSKVESMIKASTVTLNEINSAISKGTADYVSLLENIDASELKLSELKENFAKKTREAEYDLNMAVKENADKVLVNILRNKGLETAEAGTIQELKNKIEELTDDIENAKWKDEKAQKAAIESAVHAAVNNAKMSYKADSAQDKATIDSQIKELAFANKQIQSLEAMIKADRDARVKEAEARGVSAVSITNTK